MKKLALLLVSVVLFSSCDIDDDGPQWIEVPAEIVEEDLPEFFETDESYEITFVYELPSACHREGGLFIEEVEQDTEEEIEGVKIKEYNIVGRALEDMNLAECNIEDGDLEKETKVTVSANKEGTTLYIFNLWKGAVNADGGFEFETVEVPVGEPVQGGDGDGDGEGEGDA